MAKSNTRKNSLPGQLCYSNGLLLANLVFLREYLTRYLRIQSGRVTIASDKKIMRLHLGPSGIHRYGGTILAMSLIAFDPMRCEAPKVILNADLRNWLDLIESGALKLTRDSLERQYPCFALHLYFKKNKEIGGKPSGNQTSRVFLWISPKNRKEMKTELLQDACHFQEIYFDQQIQEICKMYGSGIAFSPSLQ